MVDKLIPIQRLMVTTWAVELLVSTGWKLAQQVQVLDGGSEEEISRHTREWIQANQAAFDNLIQDATWWFHYLTPSCLWVQYI